ncbi:MAG TPA: hypothetical protein DEQ20_01530 [Desulfobulbaceae bacterium]|nr:MAG: hypothetical protein A2520_02865 [Deltaproteobacteria bacterium RIFOXYD12_FULL_53_23]HCC53600.1 hypothetical protein [Desulfobulbaceae bacterium]
MGKLSSCNDKFMPTLINHASARMGSRSISYEDVAVVMSYGRAKFDLEGQKMNKYFIMMVLLTIVTWTTAHAETKVNCYKKLTGEVVCKESGGGEWKGYKKLTGETMFKGPRGETITLEPGAEPEQLDVYVK